MYTTVLIFKKTLPFEKEYNKFSVYFERRGCHEISYCFIKCYELLFPGSPWKVEVMAGPAGGGGGEPTRLIPARVPAVFEISTSPGAPTFSKNEVIIIHVVFLASYF